MNAGNALQGYNQAALNDAQAAFERQRDFEMQQRQGFQSGILGKAPNSSQSVQANKVDPFQAALGGAMSGFGFQQQYFPQQQANTAWASNAVGNVGNNPLGLTKPSFSF
jgi:hypothetical protein